MGMCIDMCIDICIDVCIDVCVDVRKRSLPHAAMATERGMTKRGWKTR